MKEQDELESEEFSSLKGSDKDEEDKPPEFNQHSQYGSVHLELNMLFPNMKVFKQVVKDYSIANGRTIKTYKE